MAKLIEAPDLTSKKQGKRLIEAPDLSGKVADEGEVVKGDIVSELTTIKKDISKLNQTIAKIVKTEIDTANTVNNLLEEKQGIIADLAELNDRVKEIGTDIHDILTNRQKDTSKNDVSALQKRVKELKEEINWFISEIAKLKEEIAKAKPIEYFGGGGGISLTEAVAAVKADGSIVLSEPVSADFKKVTNIYVEPVSGQLVVIHEE